MGRCIRHGVNLIDDHVYLEPGRVSEGIMERGTDGEVDWRSAADRQPYQNGRTLQSARDLLVAGSRSCGIRIREQNVQVSHDVLPMCSSLDQQHKFEKLTTDYGPYGAFGVERGRYEE
jgi:hypothetical protein